MRCAVLGCSTTNDEGETFFPLPKKAKLKKLWEQRIGRYDLPESAAICEKHFSPTDMEVVTGDNLVITLKENAVPSILVLKKQPEEGGTPVRRSGREKTPKSKGNFVSTEKRKRKQRASEEQERIAQKETAEKAKEEDKSPRKGKKRKATKEASDKENRAEESERRLVDDDDRGEAIAEWFLLDVFEATKAISNVLPLGAIVSDVVVENVEETVIDVVSKLLQRISSIIITSIESEFKKHSSVVMSLKNVFDKSKEIVKNRMAEEAEEAKKVDSSEAENYECVVSQFSPIKPKTQLHYREDIENSAPCQGTVVHDHAYSHSDRLITIPGDENNSDRPHLQCAFCNFKTTIKRDLRRHVTGHLKGKRYACSVCEYETVNLASYVKHIHTHTGDKPYGCKMCDYRTCNVSNLKRHELIHSDKKPFRCHECGYTCRQKAILQQHMSTHFKDKTAGKDRLRNVYVCGQCNFVTLSTKEFKQHNETDHSEAVATDEVIISTEGKVVENSAKARKIAPYSASMNPSNSSPFSDKCLFCSQTFDSVVLYDEHIRTEHKNEDKFVCRFCQHETRRYAYYKRHLLSHSNVRPFQCNVCFVKFKLNAYLKAHIRTAHEIGPFCRR